MSARVSFSARPPHGAAPPPDEGVALTLDPANRSRVIGTYRVSEGVAGAPRPAVRGLVVVLTRGGGIEPLMPFGEGVFYEDDESVVGEVRSGWFVIDLPPGAAGTWVHAFIGLAASNAVFVAQA